MMRNIRILLAISLFSMGSAFGQTTNGEILLDTGNLTVIRLHGTHSERGYAYGYLMADKIIDMYTGYILPQFGSYISLAQTLIAQGTHFNIHQEYVDEAIGVVNGMADAGADTTGISYIDMLVANCLLDIRSMGGLKHKISGPGCSSLVDWGDATVGTSLSGSPVVARHLDWSTNAVLVRNNVIVVHIPSEADEQPWLLIGYAGQMSALSGLNSSGLSVFQHQLSDFIGSPVSNMGYIPIWFCIREALEKKDPNGDGNSDVLDVKHVVSQSVNGFADGYILVACANPDSVADSLTALVAELAPVAPVHTFRGNEFPDSIPGDNLYAANYEIKRNNHYHFCSRYNNVIGAIGSGVLLGIHENWTLMRDYSSQSGVNVQFMQYAPAEKMLAVSVYKNYTNACLQQPSTFDTDTLFEISTEIKVQQLNTGEIIIHPNPASDFFSLKNLTENTTIHALRIYDQQGREVAVFTDVLWGKRINIDFLPKGKYIIVVETDSGKMTGKLVVY
ncbi:MAG: T9SS type A sorting domain-containing protein [Bacteroidetes bacterium]|nr:T9SS type A sorting domain-containing protein [Bacteroidota bacterium]MBU1717936.1 T9SS type A sorting domain-containing protein [Bacteroidota bacterium]